MMGRGKLLLSFSIRNLIFCNLHICEQFTLVACICNACLWTVLDIFISCIFCCKLCIITASVSAAAGSKVF